jgi:hypothetical protein
MNKQIMYKNFVPGGHELPQDDNGHGTHVTAILLRVAENVDIYVARVSGDGFTWNSGQVEKVRPILLRCICHDTCFEEKINAVCSSPQGMLTWVLGNTMGGP